MPLMHLDKIKFDPIEFGGQGTAVLGIRASGKSYLGTLLGERLMDAGIPIIAFDPIGVWRYLRVPGASGKGYPVVVAGGENGDLPLTPEGAPEIVRAAMRDGISLVIDLYSMKLSKADWRRIVERCVRVLLYENKGHGLRHVFIEEAAEFAPQTVSRDYGSVYAEIEKLARMGGNALLGYTLISQRAEQVNKAVLELCDNLFLFRQKGRLSLTALSKWLDIGSAKGGGEIIGSLPTLEQGVCWAWLAGHDTPIKINVPTKRSFHPDRSKMHGAVEDIINRSAVDVGSFVDTMKASLAQIVEEAQASDPKRLKARIAELEREKKVAMPPLPRATKEELDAAYELGKIESYSEGHLDGYAEGIRDTREILRQELQTFAGSFALPTVIAPRTKIPKVASTPVVVREPKKTVPVSSSNGSGLPKSLQRCLNAIAWWKAIGFEEVSRDRAAVVAGLSPTASTFGVYLSKLKDAQLVENGSPGCIKLTSKGVAFAEVPDSIDRREVARLAKEQVGGQAARVLDFVLTAYPESISRDDLADRMDLSRTASTLGVYLSKSSKLGFIEAVGGGMVRAADWLFP